MPKLGVNIDHVATVRQARQTFEPNPVWAAALAQLGGADGITIHLREDRRHIQDHDVEILRKTVSCKLNLECACNDEILKIACQVKPDQVCLVPEKREELTTEGGLNVLDAKAEICAAIQLLHKLGIEVSLFVDPDLEQVNAASECGADSVELHTGKYAQVQGNERDRELERLKVASQAALLTNMNLHAGHGLTYDNVLPVARIHGMQELNIGHSIVGRSIMVGMQAAVREMKNLVGLEG